MGVTSYTVIEGEIVSENRSGVQSDYIPDSLGSTVALVNSSHQITDTYTYWPYGEVRSHVGTSVTAYTYCGTLGYRSDSIGYYARARELKASQTRWLTVDPIWPKMFAYGYVSSRPMTFIDPSGLRGRVWHPRKLPPWLQKPIKGTGPVGIVGGAVTLALLACIHDAAESGLYHDGNTPQQYRDWCVSCCNNIFSGVGGAIGGAVGSPAAGLGAIPGGLIGAAIGYFFAMGGCPCLCADLTGTEPCNPPKCYPGKWLPGSPSGDGGLVRKTGSSPVID